MAAVAGPSTTPPRRRSVRRAFPASALGAGPIAGAGALARSREMPAGESGVVDVAAEHAGEFLCVLEQRRQDLGVTEPLDAVARAGHADGADQAVAVAEHRRRVGRRLGITLAERGGVHLLPHQVGALAACAVE